jgi:hypothetical protein
MYKYVAAFYSFQDPAETKDLNRIKNKAGVILGNEYSDYSSGYKRHTIYFEHADPTLRACDFKLPSTWQVSRLTPMTRSQREKAAISKA